MANIVLISLHDRNAYGQRLLSAQLRKHGHRCHLVFLKRYHTDLSSESVAVPDELPWTGVSESGRVFKYATNSTITEDELALLRTLLERIRPDLVGMTVSTPLRAQAGRVARSVKAHCDLPIVWGGFDPTSNPAECLRFCDYACVGDGEEAILEIAQRLDSGRGLDDVHNLAYTKGDQVVTNPKAPIENDLDRYPWRDDSPEDKYFIEGGRLFENYRVIGDLPPGSYQTMAARGCPNSCTYCCEPFLREIYRGERRLRCRTPANVVEELARARHELGLSFISFDDSVFGADPKWVREFAPLYTKSVGLPFEANIFPGRTSEECLGLLRRAGLTRCVLSLQSGSQRINETVFERAFDRGLFLAVVAGCRRLGIEFSTDVITYNPYEQEEDLAQTLDVILAIGGGFSLCVNRLFVSPGTRLADRIRRDGLLLEDPRRDALFNFYARLFWVGSYSALSRYLVRPIVGSAFLRRRPELLNPLVFKAFLKPGWGLDRLKRRLLRLVGASA